MSSDSREIGTLIAVILKAVSGTVLCTARNRSLVGIVSEIYLTRDTSESRIHTALLN